MNLVFIYFPSFFFSVFLFILFWFLVLLFFILDLDEECYVMSCVIVTQVTKHDICMIHITVLSHMLQSQVTQSYDTEKNIKDSGINNVI